MQFCVFVHLILMTMLKGRHHHCYFIKKEREANRCHPFTEQSSSIHWTHRIIFILFFHGAYSLERELYHKPVNKQLYFISEAENCRKIQSRDWQQEPPLERSQGPLSEMWLSWLWRLKHVCHSKKSGRKFRKWRCHVQIKGLVVQEPWKLVFHSSLL